MARFRYAPDHYRPGPAWRLVLRLRAAAPLHRARCLVSRLTQALPGAASSRPVGPHGRFLRDTLEPELAALATRVRYPY
jgi:hypothetical protein